MLGNSGSESQYRAEQLLLRDKLTGAFIPADHCFGAIEPVPAFAARWAAEAAKQYGNKRVLTATVNSSGACPIGQNSLCGQYCFAHRSWSADLSPRLDVVEGYAEDARQLAASGTEVGIFMSYDTEPFPGGIVSTISRRVLRVMAEYPPAALLVHSHTAEIGDVETVSILKDVAQATELIVGIGFETDSDDVGSNKPHHHPVSNRLRAFEALSSAGIKTQASTTPLLGFKDFLGFVRGFRDAGAYRIMTGELRKEFCGGGDQRARGLDIGLPAPTEEEALDVCRGLVFPGGAQVREIFYVTMT